MTGAATDLRGLLRLASKTIAAIPEACAFCPPPQPDLPEKPQAPQTLPVLSLLPSLPALASPATRPLVEAICAVSAILRWQQSYGAAEVGEDYLSRYGWFNLVSPEGPFASAELRLSFGVWDKGLVYPRHWHAPEEAYVVLAGGARFFSDGRPPRNCGPVDVIIHHSNQPHAIDMHDTPLLAMALWKGEDLLRKSTLEGAAGSRGRHADL